MDANAAPNAPAAPRLLTVCGSLQATSANRAALDAATMVAVAAGAVVDGVGLLAELPPFNADLAEAGHPAVEAWRHGVAAADLVLVATPEYAGGVAGVVKNAFDWLVGSGELYRKPVAVLSAATSGGREARRMLAQSLTWQGAYVVAQLGIAAPRTKFGSGRPDGRPTDPDTAAAISALTHQLLAAAAPGADVVARAVEVVGALGIDVAHVAPAGWDAGSTATPETVAEAPTTTLRAVPSGSSRDRYLPLFHLADDSRDQVRSYYQTGTLLALDGDDGEPIGIVLVTDPAGLARTGPEPTAGTMELKAVAVAEARQGRGVGRHLLDATLRHLRAGGVGRVIVGTASSGTGQLAFYQKAGFRLDRIERDYFTPARGYAPGLVEDGIPLRDMVWMDQQLPPPSGGEDVA